MSGRRFWGTRGRWSGREERKCIDDDSANDRAVLWILNCRLGETEAPSGRITIMMLKMKALVAGTMRFANLIVLAGLVPIFLCRQLPLAERAPRAMPGMLLIFLAVSALFLRSLRRKRSLVLGAIACAVMFGGIYVASLCHLFVGFRQERSADAMVLLYRIVSAVISCYSILFLGAVILLNRRPPALTGSAGEMEQGG